MADGQSVSITPIIDNFYIHDSAHTRSSKFAKEMGQTTLTPAKFLTPGQATPIRRQLQRSPVQSSLKTRMGKTKLRSRLGASSQISKPNHIMIGTL